MLVTGTAGPALAMTALKYRKNIEIWKETGAKEETNSKSYFLQLITINNDIAGNQRVIEKIYI